MLLKQEYHFFLYLKVLELARCFQLRLLPEKHLFHFHLRLKLDLRNFLVSSILTYFEWYIFRTQHRRTKTITSCFLGFNTSFVIPTVSLFCEETKRVIHRAYIDCHSWLDQTDRIPLKRQALLHNS